MFIQTDYYFLLKRGMVFNLSKFESTLPWNGFYQDHLKMTRRFWRLKKLKCCQCFFAILYNLFLEKGMEQHKIEYPLP